MFRFVINNFVVDLVRKNNQLMLPCKFDDTFEEGVTARYFRIVTEHLITLSLAFPTGGLAFPVHVAGVRVALAHTRPEVAEDPTQSLIHYVVLFGLEYRVFQLNVINSIYIG